MQVGIRPFQRPRAYRITSASLLFALTCGAVLLGKALSGFRPT